MAGFWSGLSSTLRGLELLADGRRLDEDALDALRLLQYRLHWSSEALAGVEPPPGAEEAHSELADALLEARDATGDVVEGIEQCGPAAAQELLFEWRGALFRVRLARLRLTASAVVEPRLERSPPFAAATATALTFLGVAAFAAGAVLILWPLWAAGLAMVAAGVLVYRP
jgi:hypothetical protein